jgi:hypothetical protein
MPREAMLSKLIYVPSLERGFICDADNLAIDTIGSDAIQALLVYSARQRIHK